MYHYAFNLNLTTILQATMSFAKAIATKYPRGVNIVAEADFFYPLPTKITDWYPTTKKPPVAKTPKQDTDINSLQYVPLLDEQPNIEPSYSLVIWWLVK